MFDLQRPQLIHIGPWGRKLSRVAGSTRLFYACKRRNRGLHVKGHLFPFSLNIRINWNNKNTRREYPALKISQLSLSLQIYISSIGPFSTLIHDVTGCQWICSCNQNNEDLRGNQTMDFLVYVRSCPPPFGPLSSENRSCRRGWEGRELAFDIVRFFLPFSRTFKRVTREINLD